MEPHPDQAGLEFRLTCVFERCCTFDGVVEPEKSWMFGYTAHFGARDVVRDRGSWSRSPGLPVDCIKERIAEQSVDIPRPQVRWEIVEVIQPVLVERIKGRVANQMVEQLLKEICNGSVDSATAAVLLSG